MEPIGWDEVFQTFEERKLAFLYQDTIHGEPSRSCEFVARD